MTGGGALTPVERHNAVVVARDAIAADPDPEGGWPYAVHMEDDEDGAPLTGRPTKLVRLLAWLFGESVPVADE